MIVTAAEMLGSVEKSVSKAREDLKEAKDELENINNRLKVEESMFTDLEAEKDEIAEEQKYIVMAIKDQIMLQNNNISEQKTDLKLLCKKQEILKRGWDF